MNILSIAGLLILLALASSCSTDRELIKRLSISTCQDVVRAIDTTEKAPPGYADLNVYASLKLHKPGAHAAMDMHGSPDYRLLLNIDGQVVELAAATCSEDNEARYLNDPEAGEGIRYRFSKRVRIKAGTHTVAVVLPADGIAVEREITLPDGRGNALTVEPIYGSVPGKRGPGPYVTTSFTKGIRSLRLTLNGQAL